MPKPRDLKKERYWRRVIRRHSASGQSVRQFCFSLGIREYQFHSWRRTIVERDVTRTAAKGFDASGQFVPVRLPFSMGAPLEVVHPGGCVIRIPTATVDVTALRRVLLALDPEEST